MKVNQIVRDTDLAKALQGEAGTFVAQQANAFGQPIGPALVIVVEPGHSIVSIRPVIEATVLPFEMRKVSESTDAAGDMTEDRSSKKH